MNVLKGDDCVSLLKCFAPLYNFLKFIMLSFCDLYKCLLRKVFGHERDAVTGEWRTLHNE